MILHIGLFFYNHNDYVNIIFEDIKALLLKLGVYDNLRISVYDDGSSDATASRILEQVNDLKIPIELTLSTENKGVKFRLDEFVRSTKNDEVVLFVAGDDGIIIDGLIEAWKSLQNSNIDVLICNAWRIRGDDRFQTHPNQWPYSLINRSPLDFHYFLTCYYPRPLLVQATLFRASALKSIDPFKWNSVLDDWPLFLKLFSNSISIKFANDIYISNYVYNPQSVSASQERILCLVDEASIENSLNKIWGPRSLVRFRRLVSSLKNGVFNYKSMALLFDIRSLVGLIMEIYYKCRSTLKY